MGAMMAVVMLVLSVALVDQHVTAIIRHGTELCIINLTIMPRVLMFDIASQPVKV
jgi:hypothetical protein